MTRCEVSVILPTFNECTHIADLLSALTRAIEPSTQSFELIVVDDDSPDGTATEAARMNDPRVRVLLRTGQRGLAKAVRYGIENCSGRVVVVMDADFNHNPADVARLLAALDTADASIGSRFVPGGGMTGPRWRFWSSRLVNSIVRIGTGSKLHENTSGFLCFSRSMLAPLNLDQVFQGYGDYCIRLLNAWQRQNRVVQEVAVTYDARKSGVSKTAFLRYFRQCLRTIWQLRATA